MKKVKKKLSSAILNNILYQVNKLIKKNINAQLKKKGGGRGEREEEEGGILCMLTYILLP